MSPYCFSNDSDAGSADLSIPRQIEMLEGFVVLESGREAGRRRVVKTGVRQEQALERHIESDNTCEKQYHRVLLRALVVLRRLRRPCCGPRRGCGCAALHQRNRLGSCFSLSGGCAKDFSLSGGCAKDELVLVGLHLERIAREEPNPAVAVLLQKEIAQEAVNVVRVGAGDATEVNGGE